MWKIVTCLTGEHDLWLVAVAGLVCLIACVTTFRLYARLQRASTGALKAVWIAFTGGVAGAGVWATHFIAMQAYKPSLETGYEGGGTLLSLAFAMGGMGLAVGVADHARRFGPRASAALGGLLLGVGVGLMHYTGMASFRTQGWVSWDLGLVALSLVLGVALSAAAVWFAGAARTWKTQAIGGGLLTLAIVALHFTGMGAVTITPDLAVDVPAQLLDAGPMVALVASITVLIILAALGTAAIEAVNQHSSLSRLREAIDAMPQSMAFFDRDDRMVIWNKRYAVLMEAAKVTPFEGMPFRHLLETALANNHLPEAVGREEEWIAERLAARKTAAGFIEQQTSDGRWMRVEDQRTADGGTVSVCIDITDLKRFAEDMAHARDEAEAANRAKSVFLANMSHEIRTPLNGVLGAADVLARSKLSKADRNTLEIIRDSGATLDRLLCDILDLSRVESGQIEIAPEPFPLGHASRAVAALAAMSARAKGLDLRLELAPEAETTVMGDEGRIKQILSNLLSNAVKFTDAGEVVLGVQATGDGFRFTVRDTGVGFDAAARERIFIRFRQADGSITRRFGGSGLGLAISRQLAELMGGTLECESTPGVGSTFVLDIPLAAAEAPAATADAAAPAIARPLSVLLVDDHPTNRKVVELMLNGSDVAVTAVEDGLQAVNAFAAGAFDLVLMDMQMPVMDGLTATREIRALERGRGQAPTLIYLLTANASPEHIQAGREAGAQRHLTKPIAAGALLAAVAEAASVPPIDKAA